MKIVQKYLLERVLEVYEFSFGGKEEGKKKKDCYCSEFTDGNKVKRVDIRCIKDYRANP